MADNCSRCISCYNSDVQRKKLFDATTNEGELDAFKTTQDSKLIKWSPKLERQLSLGREVPEFDERYVSVVAYRPFIMQFIYRYDIWIESPHLTYQHFPVLASSLPNSAIVTEGLGSKGEFGCCMTSVLTSAGFSGNNQCLPRYLYRKADFEEDFASGAIPAVELQDLKRAGLHGGENYDESGILKPVIVHDHVRTDAITKEAVAHFRQAYPEVEVQAITSEEVFYYVYGLLHSEDYRRTYANNLQKEQPRIPRVASYEDFCAFVAAGKALAQMHASFDEEEPYLGCELKTLGVLSTLEMEHPKYAKLRDGLSEHAHSMLSQGKVEAHACSTAALDKTVIHYNNNLSITKIPLEVQDFMLHSKPALNWVLDCCNVSVDKASTNRNDFNDLVRFVGVDAKQFHAATKGCYREALKHINPSEKQYYLLLLILQVINISLKTRDIVRTLPPLTVHSLDRG